MKRIVLQFLLLCLALSGQSQWEQIPGLYGGSVGNLLSENGYLFVTTNNGLYRSHDNGQHWHPIEDIVPASHYRAKLLMHRNTLLLTSGLNAVDLKQYNLYKSNDHGESWIQMEIPKLTNSQKVVANDFGIYLSSNDTIWISTDFGASWSFSAIKEQSELVHMLYEFDGNIFVMDLYSIHRSDQHADTWTTFTPTSIELPYSFHAFDSIYMAFDWDTGRMTRSQDYGATWQMHESKNWLRSNFVKQGNTIFSTSENRLYKSVDLGKTFQLMGYTQNRNISMKGSVGDTIFLGSSQGLFCSADLGQSFQNISKGIEATSSGLVSVNYDHVWTVNEAGVYNMDLATGSWSPVLRNNNSINDLILLNDRIMLLEGNNKIIRSSDEGLTWKSATSPLFTYEYFCNLFGYDHTLIAAGCHSASDMFVTEDFGIQWNLFDVPFYSHLFATSLDSRYAANDHELYKSTGHQSWEKILDTDTTEIQQITASDYWLGVVSYHNSGLRKFIIHLSSDQGQTWKLIDPDLGSPNQFKRGIEKIWFHHEHIIGLTYRGDIFISTDHGDSWQPFFDGLKNGYVRDLTLDENYIYAATSGQGVCRRSLEDLVIVGIGENTAKDHHLTLYPNPTSNTFTFSYSADSDMTATFVMTDMSGHVVFTSPVNSNQPNEIQVSELAAGLYIVSVRTPDGIHTGKVILTD